MGPKRASATVSAPTSMTAWLGGGGDGGMPLYSSCPTSCRVLHQPLALRQRPRTTLAPTLNTHGSSLTEDNDESPNLNPFAALRSLKRQKNTAGSPVPALAQEERSIVPAKAPKKKKSKNEKARAKKPTTLEVEPEAKARAWAMVSPLLSETREGAAQDVPPLEPQSKKEPSKKKTKKARDPQQTDGGHVDGEANEDTTQFMPAAIDERPDDSYFVPPLTVPPLQLFAADPNNVLKSEPLKLTLVSLLPGQSLVFQGACEVCPIAGTVSVYGATLTADAVVDRATSLSPLPEEPSAAPQKKKSVELRFYACFAPRTSSALVLAHGPAAPACSAPVLSRVARQSAGHEIVRVRLNGSDGLAALRAELAPPADAAIVAFRKFTPSGLVSLGFLEAPIIGPSFTQLRRPAHSLFIGATSPKNEPDFYVACITRLIELYAAEAAREESQRPLPLVINTNGWIKGMGFDLLMHLVATATPSMLVYLSQQPGVASPTLPEIRAAAGLPHCKMVEIAGIFDNQLQ
ncbi:Polynucleotide 5'-hydroxyl-kinase nol9, partial [Cladochytrium tenue]